jgi:hypothetical protein
MSCTRTSARCARSRMQIFYFVSSRFHLRVPSRTGCGAPAAMAPAKDMAAGYAGLSDDEDETEEAVLATPQTGLPKRGSGVFNGSAGDMAQQSLDDLAALFQTAFNELRNPHLANPVEVARKLRERVKSGALARAASRAASAAMPASPRLLPLSTSARSQPRCPLASLSSSSPRLHSDGGEHPPRQEEGGRVRDDRLHAPG